MNPVSRYKITAVILLVKGRSNVGLELVFKEVLASGPRIELGYTDF